MTSGPPTFSVVVATRNRADTLRTTLAAIKRQSFTGFETIIIDDGSAAETRAAYAAIAAELDARFQFVLASPTDAPGRGPGTARNDALARARGDFVTFCDDDDRWSDDRHLEIAAAALAASPDADFFLANQAGFRGDSLEIPDWLPQLRPLAAKRPVVAGGEVRQLSPADLLSAGGFGHLNVSIIRRDVVQAIGGFWEKVRYEEDLDFFLRAVDRSRAVLYRPAIAARHNIPDPEKRINASTQLDLLEKRLTRSLVCEHVRLTARLPATVAATRLMQGYALRHVATTLYRQGRFGASAATGAEALGLKPGLKWAGFVLFVALRALLTRR